jgi:hypothetical protein
VIVFNRGIVQDSQGDFAGAIPYMDQGRILAGGPDLFATSCFIDHVELGQYEQALADVRELPEPRRAVHAGLVAALQDPAVTDAALAQLQAHPLTALDQAWAFAKLGRRDLALDALERLFAEHDPNRVYLLQTYALRPLYPDPRFRALVRQLKLPEATLDRLAAERPRR